LVRPGTVLGSKSGPSKAIHRFVIELDVRKRLALRYSVRQRKTVLPVHQTVLAIAGTVVVSGRGPDQSVHTGIIDEGRTLRHSRTIASCLKDTTGISFHGPGVARRTVQAMRGKSERE